MAKKATKTEGGSSLAFIGTNVGVRYKRWGDQGSISLRLSDPFNIQLYLDEAFPGRPLQPAEPRGRAETRMFVTSLEPLVAVLQAGSAGPAAFNRRGFKRMDDVFAAIDARLKAGEGKPWLDGERPGLRDTSFLPLLSELESMETSFPLTLETLAAYWQRGMAYGPFQKTNHRSAEIQGKR